MESKQEEQKNKILEIIKQKGEVDSQDLAEQMKLDHQQVIGLIKALEIKETVTSPTYNLIKEYPDGQMPLYHMDLYRLDPKNNNIGITDYFNRDGICIIEWPEMREDELPEERLDIKIKIIDEETRVFVLQPHGEKYEDLCQAIE